LDKERGVKTSYHCPGFKAAGVAAGIKNNGALDLGLIFSTTAAAAAGVYTRNQVQAAPVLLCQDHLAGGSARAVIVNSGNANCYTGAEGRAHAYATAGETSSALQLNIRDVLVASTGVIGVPLPVDRIRSAIPALAAAMHADGFCDFARAIMTTDTVPKLVQKQGVIDGRTFNLLTIAKGAGMLRPDMATMLCFICTDADLDDALLQQALAGAVDKTLNRITIDGDTSTNDTVLALANGVSGVKIRTAPQLEIFNTVLAESLQKISRMLIKDGEGVTKVVEINVRGASSNEAALQIADTVAHSPLVKTAFFGQDANWGRIIAAVGRSGIPIDPDRIDLYFDHVKLVSQGSFCGVDAEAQAASIMQQSEFAVTIDLNAGSGCDAILTSDLSVAYVQINADYRT
jgi:glutamate N-acetyltransferase/amino-acid N-acetyltransferase